MAATGQSRAEAGFTKASGPRRAPTSKPDPAKGTPSMHARTRRQCRTAAIGTVAGTLTLLAVAAAGNAVDTTPSTAAPRTPTTRAAEAAAAAIPPALLQRRNEVFDRITRLRTTLGKRTDFDFSVGVNPDTNTLVVDVFSDKKVKLPDLGTALKVENHVDGQLRDLEGISGGAGGGRERGRVCTMGFAVRIDKRPATPTGFLTVAHCFDETQPADRSNFRIKTDSSLITSGVGYKYAKRSPSESDWGVVAVHKRGILNDNALGQVKAFGNKTYPVTGLREPVVGMQVCKQGATTQTTCGEVTAVAVRRMFTSGIEDDLIQTNVCAEGGDSGGPLFTDPNPNATTVEGVGLLKGGVGFPDPTNPKKDLCGEKFQRPNVSYFVPLGLALTQANAQAPQNDISLLTLSGPT